MEGKYGVIRLMYRNRPDGTRKARYLRESQGMRARRDKDHVQSLYILKCLGSSRQLALHINEIVQFDKYGSVAGPSSLISQNPTNTPTQIQTKTCV